VTPNPSIEIPPARPCYSLVFHEFGVKRVCFFDQYRRYADVFDAWPKGRKGKIDLSEAPAAYKDIDAVIEAQKDLIEVLVRLTPLGVVKG
jgi:tRNA-splicing ligase RtcB